VISVVIPVYNNINYTRSLLDNIKENVVLPDEIIIIDDGSQENYITLVDSHPGTKIRYFKNDINKGYNASVNRGISLALHPIVSVLNNDIIINKFFFKKIIEVMQDKSIGLCVPNTITGKDLYDVDEPPIIESLHQREGWAYTIRKAVAINGGYIPVDLKHFFGDDWFYIKSKKLDYLNVKILNNTIYHYSGMTLGRQLKSLLNNDKAVWRNIEL